MHDYGQVQMRLELIKRPEVMPSNDDEDQARHATLIQLPLRRLAGISSHTRLLLQLPSFCAADIHFLQPHIYHTGRQGRTREAAVYVLWVVSLF